VKELVRLFPERGELTGVFWMGRLWDLEKASYSEGYIIRPRKKSYEVSVSGNWIITPLDEEAMKLAENPLSSMGRDEGLEEAPTFKAKRLTLKTFYLYRREYAVFSGREVERKREDDEVRYVILQAEELMATFTAKWLVGEETYYKAYSTPTWMYAKKKLAQKLNPDLYIYIGLGYKARKRAVCAIKLLSIELELVEAEAETAKPEMVLKIPEELEADKEIEARIKSVVKQI